MVSMGLLDLESDWSSINIYHLYRDWISYSIFTYILLSGYSLRQIIPLYNSVQICKKIEESLGAQEI